MKCFELTLNSEVPVIVGNPAASLLRGSLFLTSSGAGGIALSAFLEISPNKSEHLKWATPLRMGDELRLKIIESDTPSPPSVHLEHGKSDEPDYPLLGCSMCMRPKAAVKRLLSGGNCSICEECVALCVESLEIGAQE